MNSEIASTEIKIFCDGGARGNPGPAASAFVVEKSGRIVYKASKYLGVATNNYAEYSAVILALRWIKNSGQSNIGILNFYLDSELVTKQLRSEYRVKNHELKKLYTEIKKLEEEIVTRIIFNNVPREKNVLADFLVNEELDSRGK